MTGMGFPLASHSNVMVDPLRTTNFPSDGCGDTEGGTARKEKSRLTHFEIFEKTFGEQGGKVWKLPKQAVTNWSDTPPLPPQKTT